MLVRSATFEVGRQRCVREVVLDSSRRAFFRSSPQNWREITSGDKERAHLLGGLYVILASEGSPYTSAE